MRLVATAGTAAAVAAACSAAAAWATSLLDPCALLTPDVTDGIDDAGPVYAALPHSCAVSAPAAVIGTAATSGSTSSTAAPSAPPRPGGVDRRVVVRVGTAFGTADRAAAMPSCSASGART